jgi:CRISPR-associated protein Csc2
MNQALTNFLKAHAGAFHSSIPAKRQNRFVQIVVLRETKSHAIFTTEGKTLDIERVQAGIQNTDVLERVVMYKRKQIAPERRNGKALLREYEILTDLEIGKDRDKKPRMKKRADCEIMGGSCGYCPDCLLYGYAATMGTGNQKTRVLSDSGFSVRGKLAIMRDIKLNAIQDTTAGGIAGSAFNSREHVIPQVFLPMVETLLDVTFNEFLYVLSNLVRTTRYGAESSREGFVRNHLLGVYFSDTELFSNLELTQLYYDVLLEQLHDQDLSEENNELPEYLNLAHFTNNWARVEERALSEVYGYHEQLAAEELSTLLSGLRSLYSDRTALKQHLVELDRELLRYALEDKTSKGRGNGRREQESADGIDILDEDVDRDTPEEE